MKLFITSSPFVDGADRAIMDPQNDLIRRLKQVPYLQEGDDPDIIDAL